jgi:hypothetical protein
MEAVVSNNVEKGSSGFATVKKRLLEMQQFCLLHLLQKR